MILYGEKWYRHSLVVSDTLSLLFPSTFIAYDAVCDIGYQICIIDVTYTFL